MFGTGEMLIIALVAIIVVDPKKLPDLMKSLGKALGEFKQMSGEFKRTIERETEAADFEKRRAEAEQKLFGDKKEGATPGEADAAKDAAAAEGTTPGEPGAATEAGKAPGEASEGPSASSASPAASPAAEPDSIAEDAQERGDAAAKSAASDDSEVLTETPVLAEPVSTEPPAPAESETPQAPANAEEAAPESPAESTLEASAEPAPEARTESVPQPSAAPASEAASAGSASADVAESAHEPTPAAETPVAPAEPQASGDAEEPQASASAEESAAPASADAPQTSAETGEEPSAPGNSEESLAPAAADAPAAPAVSEPAPPPAEAGGAGLPPSPPPPPSGDDAVGEGQSGRMSLFGHLQDLRKRLTRSAIAMVVGFLVCYAYAGQMLKILMQPMLNALKQSHFIYTVPTEAFFTEMKVAFVAGIFVASPYIFYQIYQFVAPGLYSHERRWIAPIAFFSALCFTAGAVFGYFVVFPFGFEFFASYSSDILTFTPKLDDYFDFVVKLLVAFGIVFELPLFLFFLARLGIVTHKGLRKKRKYAVLAAFVLAAALTPPDAVSQTMMAVPLVLLYEVGIWLAYFFGKKKPEPEREEAPAA